MNKSEGVAFIFDITRVIKEFYETPVIFVTKTDFSDIIFNTMCTIRTALLEEAPKSKILDIIVDFHLQWLHAVNEIENFKKKIDELTREEIYEAVTFTIDSLGHRLKYFQRYVENNRYLFSNKDHMHMQTDSEIIDEMHKELTECLLQKLDCFRNHDSDSEFKIKVIAETEELLHWLDKINDSLAVCLSKTLKVSLPTLGEDLTKTLQQIVDDLKISDSPVAQMLLDELKKKGEELGTMLRCTAAHDLEISKIIEKINIIEDRIERIQDDQSSATLALKNKKQYLEDRLSSLQDLKITIKSLEGIADVKLTDLDSELWNKEDYYQLRIFNHALPLPERERLITELCYIWDIAVFGVRSRKSIISILSATDMKEEFNDDLGIFYIDEHSRKIYRKPSEDTLYQPNEINELVPLSDDTDHIYFYDECGRYFVDQKTRQRVYKAHATASEYMMDTSGVLLKIKEERDGVTYYYDNYGRYYINESGKHIYREIDAMSEYENDGHGNLVRIHSHLDIFEPCPDDAHVTEDCNYLKQNVGAALRECIADCILHQPVDPIKFLAARLIKYRENIEWREEQMREKAELDVEREIKLQELRALAEQEALEAALREQGGSEASYDSNLIHYTSMHPDNSTSAESQK